MDSAKATELAYVSDETDDQAYYGQNGQQFGQRRWCLPARVTSETKLTAHRWEPFNVCILYRTVIRILKQDRLRETRQRLNR